MADAANFLQPRLHATRASCQEDAALLEQFAQPRHAETQFVVVQGIRAQAVLAELHMSVSLFHLATGEHQGAAAEGHLGIAQQQKTSSPVPSSASRRSRMEVAGRGSIGGMASALPWGLPLSL